MKIQRVNAFFKQLGEFQIRYRWQMLVFILLLTVFGFSGLPRVSMESNVDEWFDKDEEIQIAEDKFEELFGNNESIGLLIEADDVFHPEVLKMIKEIGEELTDKVPYADDVTSLMDFELTIGTKEGIEVINPFEDGVPDDLQKLKETKELILSRQSVVNKMVSRDATETWLVLSLDEYPEKEEWKKESDTEPLYQDGAAAMAIVTDPKWQSDLYTIKATGLPYTEMEEKIFFGRETKLRVLSGFVVMIILLTVFLRSFRGIIVPAITSFTGIAVVFGVMGWLRIGLDANMVTLPVLLAMALSVGYSIHLVNAFKRNFRQTGKRRQSVITAVEETGWPILFTAITTMGSMMSFTVAGIMPVRWVGYTSAAGVFSVYLFVMILIPIFMSFGKDQPHDSQKQLSKKLPFNTWMQGMGLKMLDHKWPVATVFILVIVGFAPGIAKIGVNMDIFEFMGLKVPYVKRTHEVVQSQLGSYISYNITVTYDEKDAIKDPEVMKKFDRLLTEVGNFELTKKSEGEAKITSILDIIKDMNQTFHSDNPSFYKVPEHRDLIAQLLFLYEISGGDRIFDWINEDYSILRARVELTRFESNEIERELARIKTLGQELFPEAKVATIGSAVRFAELNRKIVSGELKSFFTALCVIGILLALVFGSIKTGLIGMIPNVSPLIILGGIMGYFSYQMDMMNMMIIPMLLGVAVDDSIHFINQIKYEFEVHGNYRTAISNSFYVVGKTLTMTTIILATTFAMYMFSPVNNMFRVGLLSMTGLITALVADFTLTPIVILLTKPFGKERKTHEASAGVKSSGVVVN
ncbi:MAG: MMPL family transporter [Proteobacteria bacterium]|nr:MMPL family transporter [Pseudomonadota bacterium]